MSALPVFARALLLSPARIDAGLARIAEARVVATTPNAWQITLGVLRMWHRVLFRSGTIGTCREQPVRATWRARLLSYRPLHFPFLLAERAVAPWDFSGLLSSPDRVICHLLAAHHDGDQFAYDLQMLALHPGRLEELHRAVQAVLADDGPRGRWLRDLTVFAGYHENLLIAVERALRGELAPTVGADDPDISFFAYLDWCARQPPTPGETLEAWRAHRWTVADGVTAVEVLA